MATLDYKDLTERLFQRLPELRLVYQEEFRYWWDSGDDEPPGPHVVYGDVLTPRMISLLMSGDDDEQLRRIFGLLEEMATSTDVEVRSVLTDTICEYLVDRKGLYKRAKPFMGLRTHELCRSVET